MFRNLSIVNKVIVIVTVGFTLVAVMIGSYYVRMEKRHLESLLLKQARTLFDQVQQLRHWNASHGGVYVMLEEGQSANPYLYSVGPGQGRESPVEPEIADTKGRRLALINPALMTRELARIVEQNTEVRFHLTSLQLINPNNAPDDFETRALKSFEQGQPSQTRYTELDGKRYFRFMAPLLVEPACLSCHGFQGYKVGDVRGGISVSLPISNELAVFDGNRRRAMAMGVLLYLMTVVLLAAAIRAFVGRPLRELMAMSSRIGTDTFEAPEASEHKDEIGSLWRTLVATNEALRSQRRELEDYAKKMDEKSRVDSLTKAYNRHHLYSEAPKLFSIARRKSQPISTLMIDIDHFKRINDTHGHKVGDDVLVLLADIIQSEIRSYDLFVRLGGEEFLLIMPDTNAAQAHMLAERIRKSIEKARLPLDETDSITFQVSIGIASSENTTLERAMVHADEALYEAKGKGRNQVCTYAEAAEQEGT